jgi:tetratricopeptide (TPR) repeat protein
MICPEPSGPREAIWREALTSGSAAERSEAALRLGRMLLGTGEREDGEELLRGALAGGDPRVAPAAAWALAEALLAEGRGVEASEFLTKAAAGADASLSPDVVLALAARCAAVGQTGAAVSLYRELIAEEGGADRERLALVCFRLGEILLERDEEAEAMTLLVRAFRSGSADLRPHAAIILGEIAAERDVKDLAVGLLGFVIDSEHADLAPRAGYELARLRRKSGDEVEAARLLRAVALSAHPMYAEMAEEELLGLISILDVSDAIEEVVDDVLGPKQLGLHQEIWHRRAGSTYAIGSPRRVAYVVPYRYVVLSFYSLSEVEEESPRAPLLLEAGESLVVP